jgi:hypothetical protein
LDSRVLRKWTTTSNFKWYTNALKFKYSLHNHISQQVENSKYLGVDNQGWIQDFKLGGGGALKKIAPSGGGHEHFWGISCEKSRFYAKKSNVFQLRREARKVLGISCEKSRFYAKKSYFFQNIRDLDSFSSS